DGLRAFAPNTSGQLYLMNIDGSLITSSKASSAQVMRTKMNQQVLAQLKAREGSIVSYEGFDETDVVGSLKRVPRVHWDILAEIPADTAYWQVVHFRNMTLLIVGALLLGVSVIAYRLGVV